MNKKREWLIHEFEQEALNKFEDIIFRKICRK